jgi:AcrR family transcriptional regulator
MPKMSEAKPAKTIRVGRLTVEDWIKAARGALIKSGIDGTKVDLLARKLKVTRGSFYWHFENRAALLGALLEHWEATNNAPMLGAIGRAGERGDRADFAASVGRLWADEKDYSPAYDSAVRDWARTDAKAAAAVHRVDAQRIEALRRMFEAYGFAGDEALVRARITYFHQVGYYALKFRESPADRERLGPVYDQVLLY